jgi:hypothetical protein
MYKDHPTGEVCVKQGIPCSSGDGDGNCPMENEIGIEAIVIINPPREGWAGLC